MFRKKTEHKNVKGVDKGTGGRREPLKKANSNELRGKGPSLSNYKNAAPRRASRQAKDASPLSEHDAKVKELERKIEEKRKRNNDYLERKKHSKPESKNAIPSSYLKDKDSVSSLRLNRFYFDA